MKFPNWNWKKFTAFFEKQKSWSGKLRNTEKKFRVSRFVRKWNVGLFFHSWERVIMYFDVSRVTLSYCLTNVSCVTAVFFPYLTRHRRYWQPPIQPRSINYSIFFKKDLPILCHYHFKVKILTSFLPNACVSWNAERSLQPFQPKKCAVGPPNLAGSQVTKCTFYGGAKILATHPYFHWAAKICHK